MVHGERAAAIRKDRSAWCLDFGAKGSTRQPEATENRSEGAFAEANDDSGPDNLDLATKKLRAIVKPRWLNLSLKPTV